MRNPLAFLYEKWQERRRARATAVLEELKVRYHTFRILLANNEASLDLLRSVEQGLASPAVSWEDVLEKTEELLEVTYEMVDGLNRLAGNGYQELYARHRGLSSAIESALGAVAASPAGSPGCIFFENITADHGLIVGGKAASLALLKRAGLPVPDGFAITSRACAEVLTAGGLDAFIRGRMQRFESGGLQPDDLEADASEIRKRILGAELPSTLEAELRASYERLTGGAGQAVSVRSSALVEDRPEHSFAGQFKSVLNVTSFDGFTEALKEVIASGFSSRSVSYRRHAGLPLTGRDMAVFCQRMAPARAAGVLFTLDPGLPENGRMLLSAVPGLGILAVSGSAPADLYRPLRDTPEREPAERWAQIAAKTHRAVPSRGGGIFEEPVPAPEREAPVLRPIEVFSLVRHGRMIETLLGNAQDIEWAMAEDGSIAILQSRDIRLSARDRRLAESVRGEVLLRGGVCASPGRGVGRVKIVHSLRDLETWRESRTGPGILVLHQSIVDAAGWLPEADGVIVDLGNPADHLSCVAREYSRPMLTGIGKATQVLRDGQWVVLDSDRGLVLQAPEDIWSRVDAAPRKPASLEGGRPGRSPAVAPEIARLHELIEPLNLTDAYGPTFSINECKSVHDIVRFTHEMAVLAMFRTGDSVLEEADMLVHLLSEGSPLHFLIIDLGGGINPGRKGFKVRTEDLLSAPLLALLQGIAAPGLRWNLPAPMPDLSGLFSRAMLDARSARPVGQQNYALVTRDYLNLNARVDFHFTMVDSVCAMNPRENYIRFRFKGGGTTAVQRERRARFVAQVLREHDFFTDQRGDLVTASILEMQKEEIEARLAMAGRLMGFSRLLDAAMLDDDVPGKVARAFMDGDYGLTGLKEELGGS